MILDFVRNMLPSNTNYIYIRQADSLGLEIGACRVVCKVDSRRRAFCSFAS